MNPHPIVKYQGAVFSITPKPSGNRIRISLSLTDCEPDSQHYQHFTRYGLWYNPITRQICDHMAYIRVYPGEENMAVNRLLMWSKINGADLIFPD